MTDHDDREVDEMFANETPGSTGTPEEQDVPAGTDAENEGYEFETNAPPADEDDSVEPDEDDDDAPRTQRGDIDHDANSEGVRLQKVLAQAGVASRRGAEEMVSRGRVEVNGILVSEQGMRVDPERDTIRVDGMRIPPPRRHVYLVVNKPRGVVSTMEDPEGRPCLGDIQFDKKSWQQLRLFHVGRLDTDTEGLIILTNHGEFAHRLSHPKYVVPKTYLAEVEGMLDNKTLRRLEKGLRLDDGPVKPDKVKLVMRSDARSMLEITLHEGRNRIVRRMMDSVAHPVHKLSRTAIGPVRLGQLPPSDARELTRDEVGALLDLIDM